MVQVVSSPRQELQGLLGTEDLRQGRGQRFGKTPLQLVSVPIDGVGINVENIALDGTGWYTGVTECRASEPLPRFHTLEDFMSRIWYDGARVLYWSKCHSYKT